MNMLDDDRKKYMMGSREGYQMGGYGNKRKAYGAGGEALSVILKIFGLGKKTPPKVVKEKDIQQVLDNLSDEDMARLSPIEIEQLMDLDIGKNGIDIMPLKSTRKDVDKAISSLTPKEIKNLSPLEREQLLDMDLEKYGVDGREGRGTGGLLQDDRDSYGAGGKLIQAVKELPDVVRDLMAKKAPKESAAKTRIKQLESEADRIYKVRATLQKEKDNFSAEEYNDMLSSVDGMLSPINDRLKKLGVNPSRKNFEANTRTTKVEGGILSSDNEMEKDYLEFIIGEALSEEEEDMLMSKLEQDDEMSILFDKVIDMAQEFAGSGPVEGPGTGVSDSIPARLSDGEFVFTAKAVEEIGEDVLMSMMKDAEAAAEERKGFAMGEGVYDEEEIDDVSNDMRKVNPRLNPNSR